MTEQSISFDRKRSKFKIDSRNDAGSRDGQRHGQRVHPVLKQPLVRMLLQGKDQKAGEGQTKATPIIFL